jgi:hypothetical protein
MGGTRIEKQAYIYATKLAHITKCMSTPSPRGYAVAWLVEAVCYKPEGLGFES